MPLTKPLFHFKNKCLLCQKPCRNKYCNRICREIAFLRRRFDILDKYRRRLDIIIKYYST